MDRGQSAAVSWVRSSFHHGSTLSPRRRPGGAWIPSVGRCSGSDAKTQLCGDGGVRANVVQGDEIGSGGVGGWRLLEGKMWGAGVDGEAQVRGRGEEAGRGGVGVMRVAAARRVPRGVPMGTREGCGVG
jgi:hypothetical protein